MNIHLENQEDLDNLVKMLSNSFLLPDSVTVGENLVSHFFWDAGGKGVQSFKLRVRDTDIPVTAILPSEGPIIISTPNSKEETI